MRLLGILFDADFAPGVHGLWAVRLPFVQDELEGEGVVQCCVQLLSMYFV